MDKLYKHDCDNCKYLFSAYIEDLGLKRNADIYLSCNWDKEVNRIFDKTYSLQALGGITKFIIRYSDSGADYFTINMFKLGSLFGKSIDVYTTEIRATSGLGNAQECRIKD